jgi:hypothetical protein
MIKGEYNENYYENKKNRRIPWILYLRR